MTRVEPLKPEDLYLHTNPETLRFQTTAELDEFKEIIGQPRAVEAMRFGTIMDGLCVSSPELVLPDLTEARLREEYQTHYS